MQNMVNNTIMIQTPYLASGEVRVHLGHEHVRDVGVQLGEPLGIHSLSSIITSYSVYM